MSATVSSSDLPRRNVRNVVVTGGTAGLGFEALKQLVSRKDEVYHIIVGCRKTPSSEVVEELRRHRHSSDTIIDYLPLDLASSSSIESFANQVKEKIQNSSRIDKEAQIDILFLCAGALFKNYESVMSSSGKVVEATLFVNTLSHALLIKLLLPHLSSTGRIAIVNSKSHLQTKSPVTPSTIDAALNPASKWPGMVASYAVSKLVEMHLAFIVDDKLRASGSEASVISTHPGFVPDTSLARDTPWIVQFIMNKILPVFPFSTSLRTGGSILVRSMVDEHLRSTTYLTPKGIENVASECNDTDLRQEWASWLREVGVWN